MKADRIRSRLPTRRIHTMQLFRHLGLMIAVFWCAAMAVAPIAAAGAGQDMNQAPGPEHPFFCHRTNAMKTGHDLFFQEII